MIKLKLIMASLLCVVHLIYGSSIPAQNSMPQNKPQEGNALPRSFMIGEYEQPYENLINQYDKLLLTVCDNNMPRAFDLWNQVMADIEAYSIQNQFDLNGLKLWMNVFFNADGTIQHIVYFPKPNSRNMQFDKLTAFFAAFTKSYQLKPVLSSKCSHYGSASFPGVQKH
jgi:hypothetical protein